MLFLTSNELEEWMTYVNKNWGWFLALGIGLCLLGGAAIGMAGFTTWVSTVFLGSFLIVAGAIQVIHSFRFRFGHGFLLNLVVGILSAVAGALMSTRPAIGALGLTMLIASYFFGVGFFRCVFSASVHYPRWGWGFFAGIVDILFGAYVISNLPFAALTLVGILVGIDMIVNGAAWIALALAGRGHEPAVPDVERTERPVYSRASGA